MLAGSLHVLILVRIYLGLGAALKILKKAGRQFGDPALGFELLGLEVCVLIVGTNPKAVSSLSIEASKQVLNPKP